MNRLLDVVTGAWAIIPDKLVMIANAYERHLMGEKADLKAIEASIGKPLGSAPQDYEVVNGVAIVPIMGTIARRANLFTDISGGASSDLIGRDLRAAAANRQVSAILLHIDSPGGTVAGTQQLADIVREVGAIKPVIALADGTMASAAYWIGSAAQAVYIADTTTEVGSIGVATVHRDVSAAEAQRGIKTTDIYSGKFKRIATSYAPLSEEGRASIQDYIDYLYGQFVDAVAANRGATADKVLSDMADGRIFVGQQAIDAGLADGVATAEQLITRLAAGEFTVPGVNPVPPSKSRADLPNSPKGTTMSITREQLAAESPDVLAEIQAEARTAGATAERDRILGIEAHAMVGHEALIASLKADGKTTPDQAAAQVLGAHRAALAKQATTMAADAPEPLPAAPTSEPTAGAKAKPDQKAIAARARELVATAEAAGQRMSYAVAATKAAAELAQG